MILKNIRDVPIPEKRLVPTDTHIFRWPIPILKLGRVAQASKTCKSCIQPSIPDKAKEK